MMMTTTTMTGMKARPAGTNFATYPILHHAASTLFGAARSTASWACEMPG